MKKQTIKLNESLLRNIIKEALNELDWKTYANAAKKQADADGEYKLSHDKSNRAYKFNLAASNEFNKKYGHKGNYTDDFTRLHANEPTNWGTTELPKLHLNASDLCDDEHGFLGRDFDEKDKPYWVNKNQHGELKQVKKIPPKTFERHPELMQKFKDAEQEMENYYNGDYDYTPDKGWHLKESQLRNIIKESIKKVLKENDFTPHGYMTTSNLGGKEIEISNSNDAVRFRTEDGSISDWFEIEYDEEGNPIVNTPWGTEELNNYMKFN